MEKKKKPRSGQLFRVDVYFQTTDTYQGKTVKYTNIFCYAAVAGSAASAKSAAESYIQKLYDRRELKGLKSVAYPVYDGVFSYQSVSFEEK